MLFTDSHEWVRVENEVGYIGISRYAQKELGEIVYVQLPQIGRELKVGEEVAILESTKAAADIYSPVSGIVIAINPAIQENPLLVNHSPENEGWLFKVKLTKLKELDHLLDLEHYLRFNAP